MTQMRFQWLWPFVFARMFETVLRHNMRKVMFCICSPLSVFVGWMSVSNSLYLSHSLSLSLSENNTKYTRWTLRRTLTTKRSSTPLDWLRTFYCSDNFLDEFALSFIPPCHAVFAGRIDNQLPQVDVQQFGPFSNLIVAACGACNCVLPVTFATAATLRL